MAKKPIRELDWLEAQARFFIEVEANRDRRWYSQEVVEEYRVQLERELEFAKLSFEERYGEDLARRLREQQKYLRFVRLSKRWARSRRQFHSFYEVINEIVRLRDLDSNPLRWSEYLLYLLLPKEERETVPGDLLEEYQTVILPKFGVTLARIWFLKQVLSSTWPFLRRRIAKLLGLAALLKYLK